MSNGIFYSLVRTPEIVNSYDFQVAFWDFAFKDKTSYLNFPDTQRFISLIFTVNYVHQHSFESISDSVCEGLVPFINIMDIGLCLFKHMLVVCKK